MYEYRPYPASLNHLNDALGIHPPMIIWDQKCELCHELIEVACVRPGDMVGLSHADCKDKEYARMRRLCPCPYQHPRRSKLWPSDSVS